MTKIETVRTLRSKASDLKLEGQELLWEYPLEELATIYNGVGSSRMPAVIRKALTLLNPTLLPAVLIHDVRHWRAEGGEVAWHASNDELKRNGIKCAKSLPWYNLRRYVVMFRICMFADLCDRYGFSAWGGKDADI